MTKKEHIDYVRNNLAQLDRTNKYHPNQVAFGIEQACQKIFYDLAQKSPKDLDRYSFLSKDNAIAQDTSINRYYISLADGCYDVPLKASGVLELIDPSSTFADQPTLFVPMTSIEMSQLHGLEGTLGTSIIGYAYSQGSTSGMRIDLFGASDQDDITVRYLKRFTDYSDTDQVNLPYGKDYDISTMVLQILANIPPKDLINDNSDT